MIQLGAVPGESARPSRSRWAADDILPALTRRVAGLEAQLASMQEDLDAEQRRLATYSESDRSLDKAVADGYRSADAILRRAGAEANEALKGAVDERRMLVNEVQRLRDERQDLQDEIASLRRGGIVAVQVETPPAFDLETAIAEEMRALLVEILADFRSGVAAPPPAVEPVSAETLIVAHVVPETPEPIVDEVVVDVQTALPPAAVVETDAAPIERFESIVEHVDELVRLPFTEPIIDEYIEELRASAPIAATGALEVEAAATEPAPPIVDDYDDLRVIDTVAPFDVLEAEAAPAEPAPPIADEHVFEALERSAPIVDEYVEDLRRPESHPPLETIEPSVAMTQPTAPIDDEYVEDLRRPESHPPLETIEPSEATTQPMEPVVEEYVEEFRTPEVIEPIAPYFAPAEPAIDVAIGPMVPPPPPDARIDALWSAATLPAIDATSTLSSLEPASEIVEEFIAETRPLEIPEAPLDAPQELAPDPTIDFAPAPPVQFVPIEPEIVEREPDLQAEPFITETDPAPTSAVVFPELRVADERGLHQIQIVISPIHSFPRLLETERRIRALSTVNALRLRDFRNGVATFVVAVSEAISPAEFGAVIQMLESLHLRLEGTTQSSVELHAEDEPTTD